MVELPQEWPLSRPISDAALRPHGWAPGNYMALCVNCQRQHTDTDKRSLRCRPCAILHLKDAAVSDADIKRIKRRARVNIQSNNIIQELTERVTKLEKIVEHMSKMEKWL